MTTVSVDNGVNWRPHQRDAEGQVIIRPVRERHVYCVNSAHAEFGVRMILDGSIQGFILPGTAPVFRRLLVGPYVPQTPSSLLSGGNDELMRLKEAELALTTTTSTINDLVERGYLRERGMKRASGHTVRMIDRRSLAEFDAVHVSLSAINKARKGYRVIVKAELDALGIEPVFEPIGFNARFFRRADLCRVGYDISC